MAASCKAATDRYTFWKTYSCLPISFFYFACTCEFMSHGLMTNETVCEIYGIDTKPTVNAYCTIHMPLGNDVVESSTVKMNMLSRCADGFYYYFLILISIEWALRTPNCQVANANRGPGSCYAWQAVIYVRIRRQYFIRDDLKL